MKCAIMQPTYNPWLGYFDLIDKVDIFVFLDIVQLARRSWQVRNKIKAKTGEFFLTIPIKKTLNRDLLTINKAIIFDEINWRYKHLKTIELNYKKATYFKEVFPFISELINFKTKFLSEFNINIIERICHKIGINSKFIRASKLGELSSKKDRLLTDICQLINYKTYISPKGSMNYIEVNSAGGEFSKKDIALYYHNYHHPNYEQLFGKFISHLGIFDLLLNEGFDNALKIIRKGRSKDLYFLNL